MRLADKMAFEVRSRFDGEVVTEIAEMYGTGYILTSRSKTAKPWRTTDWTEAQVVAAAAGPAFEVIPVND